MNMIILILLVAGLLCLYRLFAGPEGHDRFLALIVLTLLSISFLGVSAVATGSEFLIDLTLDVAVLAFIGSMAVAKYMEGKELDE